MNNYLNFKKSNCKNCYKCIRHCPVKSIRFSDNQAHIVEEECILCGMCFVVCPQNAKEIRNDVEKVKELIALGYPVFASIAPSFIANYNGINFKTMEKALQRLGFVAAEETAIGATMVKTRYESLIKENSDNVLISSCCHTINTLIQKYYPEVLPYLAPVISPMQAHCTRIKEEHPGASTVFIGPCISKKAEAHQYPGIVDCVLTFEELSGWLSEEKISFENTEETCEKGKTRLFPTAGGIIRSMICNEKDYGYINIDGIDNCINAIKDIINGSISRCFIEMSACAGSCVGGPAMDKKHKAPIRDLLIVNNYAGENDFNVEIPYTEALKKDISFIGLNRHMPSSNAIDEILSKMGKVTLQQELNCGSCGYDTCREKAIAVYLGKAELSMCLPYLNEKAESFSDNIINNTPNGIIVLNESLEVQQINNAACDIMNIKNVCDVIGSPVVRILDPQGYHQVLLEGQNMHNKRVYLAEYNKYVEETIIFDKNYHIIVSIMRDVTEEEIQRSKKENISKHTIEITDKVIEKQMRVVQEIASLLGETIAETKIALTNLKGTLNDE